MSAFLEWLNGTDPCTPMQACGIIVGVVAFAVFNFWILFGVVEPWRTNRNNNKKGN